MDISLPTAASIMREGQTQPGLTQFHTINGMWGFEAAVDLVVSWETASLHIKHCKLTIWASYVSALIYATDVMEKHSLDKTCFLRRTKKVWNFVMSYECILQLSEKEANRRLSNAIQALDCFRVLFEGSHPQVRHGERLTLVWNLMTLSYSYWKEGLYSDK